MYKFPYSDDNKRYHTLSFHNRAVYGGRVFKAAVDAGFSCPNADGTTGSGGCIFCRFASGYFTARPDGLGVYDSVMYQLNAEKERIYKKYPDSGIIAYFQSGTNTYAPTAALKEAYRAALDFGADGISIATRPDCLGEEVMEVLCDVAEKTRLTVELGLQTVHDKTAAIIGRGCGYSQFLTAYNELRRRGIRVCVHIINGLPGEDEQDMISTAQKIGELSPDGIKIHLLHVLRDTELGTMYLRGGYTPMEKEKYIAVTVKQLEYLPQTTVIERITGDGDKRFLLAPMWSRDKISVLGGIDKMQAQLDSYQGKALE